MPNKIGQKCPKAMKDSCESSDARDLSDELYERLDDFSGKWETVAREMGIDVSLLSHWTSGRGPMPLYRLIRLTDVIGPGLLRWIARRCGYTLTRIDHERSTDVRRTNEKATRDGVA